MLLIYNVLIISKGNRGRRRQSSKGTKISKRHTPQPCKITKKLQTTHYKPHFLTISFRTDHPHLRSRKFQKSASTPQNFASTAEFSASTAENHLTTTLQATRITETICRVETDRKITVKSVQSVDSIRTRIPQIARKYISMRNYYQLITQI